MQVDVPGAFTVAGLQLSELNCAAGATVTIAVLPTPPALAITVTVSELETIAGVAANVTLVAPLGTTTEVGTVRLALLLDSETVTPPDGAAAVNVTVQVEVVGEVTVAGLQASVLRLGRTGDSPRMAPPEPLLTSWIPVSDEAKVLDTPRFADVTPEATFTFTTATVPFAIRLLFIPYATQVTFPVVGLQDKDLPAAVIAEPGATEIELSVEVEYVSDH